MDILVEDKDSSSHAPPSVSSCKTQYIPWDDTCKGTWVIWQPAPCPSFSPPTLPICMLDNEVIWGNNPSTPNDPWRIVLWEGLCGPDKRGTPARWGESRCWPAPARGWPAPSTPCSSWIENFTCGTVEWVGWFHGFWVNFVIFSVLSWNKYFYWFFLS